MAAPTAHRDLSWLVETGLIVGFLAVAAWFVFGSKPVDIPGTLTAAVSERDLSTDPLRVGRMHVGEITIGSFTRRCGECHDLFPSGDDAPRERTEHQHVVLDHGLNDRCFNCHDRENRDRLALRGGVTISYEEVPRLCAKCHGPTYRDWQRGMHGRTTGSWDPGAPNHARLVCSDCHSPHAPAYAPLRPLPGPRTLRMGGGEREVHGEAVEHVDPLRKWHEKPVAAPVLSDRELTIDVLDGQETER
ncbi:MAG: hypothetical protein GY715_01125 [Planctomycetes bacterium]|nr:hypothetical protein [Planctomycetota bacterium]